jgi:hypothetical protein
MLPKRTIPILLTLSCLFFLLASSILVFVLTRPQSPVAATSLTASPNQLRVGDQFELFGKGFGARNAITFTYDVNNPITDASSKQPLTAYADSQGAFTVFITVPTSWGTGDHIIHATDEAQRMSVSTRITITQAPPAPPHLQLSTSQINLGSDQYESSITLKNAGGGQITWTAHSDASWLTVTPPAGSFFGSALVSLSVNHSGLAPQTYTGHLSFNAKESGEVLPVTVTMQVDPSPASLNISTTALSFSTLLGQSTANQSITLQNSGGVALNWTSSVITGNGSPWLSLFPTSGTLEPGSSSPVFVSVQSQQLAAGQYDGTITLYSGTNTQARSQINVSLSILTPPNLVLSSLSLSASTVAGQTPAHLPLTLQNSGALPLNWTASSNQPWLSLTPNSGSIVAGGQISAAVVISAASLKVGSYQGIINFSYGNSTKQATVSLTVTAPPAPAIGVPVTSLTFTTYQGTNPPAQSLTVTNTGNAALDWVATEDSSGASFAPVSPTSGTLAPGASATLTVTPNVATATAGTLTTTITIADSDTGTTVASRKLPVSITILNQANITVSSTQLSCNNSASAPQTSTVLQISNTGSATLNWLATPQASATWLSVDVSSGSIAPGNNMVINVQCDSSQLAPGTYTATLVISDSDANTPVASQTVNVTLTVQ